MRNVIPLWMSLVSIAAGALNGPGAELAGPWFAEKARAWEQDKPWLSGCDLAPGSALDPLEMGRADTFEPILK